MKAYPTICASESGETVMTLAVKNGSDGKALLVVDYGGTKHDLSLQVKGVAGGAKVSCTVLDWTHDLEPHPVRFENGTLSLRKNDSYSAAFLVEFEPR